MRKVARVSDLIAINVNQVINDQYHGVFRDHITVTSIGNNQYCLSIFNMPFKLSSSELKGNITYRGGRIPFEKADVWYVHSNDNPRLRFRYLYVNEKAKLIGTRDMHSARLNYNCFSNKQRLIHRAGKAASKGIIIETVEPGPPKKTNDATLIGQLRQQIDQMKHKK